MMSYKYKYSPKRHRPIVYFAKVADQDLIKIGTTRNLEQRLVLLEKAIASKMELLGLIHGDYHMEHIVWEYFRLHIAKGDEWFSPCSELLEFIKTNTTKNCPPFAPFQPDEEVYYCKSGYWRKRKQTVSEADRLRLALREILLTDDIVTARRVAAEALREDE